MTPVKEDVSVLVEFLGDHPLVRIVDFLLENRLFDYSKKQIAEGAGIGKVTLFKYWDKIEAMGLVKVSRKFGKTSLYKLNAQNKVVRQIMGLELVLMEAAAPEAVKQKCEKLILAKNTRA